MRGAGHRQLLHGDVLFSVGVVRMAESPPQGAACLVRDRLLRLGLPFAICALTVIPVAYYAISLRLDPEISFSDFWWKTITVGPWPSAPIWFVWVLLAFDLTASLLYRLSPGWSIPINGCRLRAHERPLDFFLFMLAVTAVVYIPARVYYTPNHWFEFGPFSVAVEPRAALRRLLLHRSRRRRGEF